MRVHFTNLGCKLNQAELEALARRFVAAGHTVVRTLEQADLHVVNSCTVTHVAARDSRKIARRGKRVSPRVKTVLTGCYVAAEPADAAALAGVDLIVPNTEKEQLLERVHERFPLDRPAAAPDVAPCSPPAFGNSRALVKIEDGCNMRCSFCIIPTTRGAQTSRSPDEIRREIEALAAAGTHEVVITGVQISSYRHGERGETRLYDLVADLLEHTSVPRLRLTSIAPWQFDPRLLELFTGGRVCRHVHLSLQSGARETLVRMRRPYSPAGFRALAETLRARVAGLAITTDVIVGFPGESEAEFEESLAFVESLAFSRIHAFPFSQRFGTEAAEMPDQVPHAVKRERMRRLLAVAEASERSFRQANLGTEAEVLWERRRAEIWQGTTDNYIRAFRAAHPSAGDPNLMGRASRVRLARLEGEGMAVESLLPGGAAPAPMATAAGSI